MAGRPRKAQPEPSAEGLEAQDWEHAAAQETELPWDGSLDDGKGNSWPAPDEIQPEDERVTQEREPELEGPEWGWWSVYDKQATWLEEALRHIPWPEALPPAEALTGILSSKLLQEFGSYLAYLHANQGLLQGRAYALKEVYENAMMAQKDKLRGKYATETARESAVLSLPGIGEALRDAKRRHIEIEACIISQKGLISAYEKLWETISRQITAAGNEMRLATERAT
jgi:hypothetical protein